MSALASDLTPAPAPLLEVDAVSKHFPVRGGMLRRVEGYVQAVSEVSFSIAKGEVVGLVGESGSGKTTLGHLILALVAPTAGSIRFEGRDVAGMNTPELRQLRRRMQVIFQDPFSSLNPRLRVRDTISEGLVIQGMVQNRAELEQEVSRLLQIVGLSPRHADRFPHEFSGGQRQRIGIARSLAVKPQFIVADEPVSALDVSIQAQILNLLLDLQERLHLSMLFIGHDLAVVRHVARRIIVMYLGRVMETATTDALFDAPRHPYTEALLSAVPGSAGASGGRVVLKGDIPSPLNPPSGCVFRTRCRYALPACAEAVPELREVADGHQKACIRDDVL